MKIIKAIFFAALVAAIYSCSDAPETPPPVPSDSLLTEEALPQVDILFPELDSFLLSADSSFSIAGFEGGETEIKNDSADRSFTENQIEPFLPYLVYNGDSSYAIDLVSFNFVPSTRKGKTRLDAVGPDFEVNLLDLKNKRRRQLLFFGTMGAVLDARWQDNQTVLIMGANEIAGKDSLRPVIWKYVVPTGSWSVYTYEKMVPADWSSFRPKWLRRDE
jgi:hypothetical protein